MKAWWLGFPRFRCPHCGKPIAGVKFVGHFKLPKVRRELADTSGGGNSGESRLVPAVSGTRLSKPSRRGKLSTEKKEVKVDAVDDDAS